MARGIWKGTLKDTANLSEMTISEGVQVRVLIIILNKPKKEKVLIV